MEDPDPSQLRTLTLRAEPLSAERFAPFGQVVGPTLDGVAFDPGADARLDLAAGTPRLYIMRLPPRGRAFHRITFHAAVTQCLGGLAPARPWVLVVAPPTGDVARFPAPEDLHAFVVPHGVFLKLERGTWHAGPLFDAPTKPDHAPAAGSSANGPAGAAAGADPDQDDGHMDFFNLELSDTNVADHNTHDYARAQGLRFVVEESAA